LKEEIEKFIDEMLSKVPFKTVWEILEKNELWAPEMHDMYRKKMAEYIVRLQSE